jgi:Tol biopolymer transport system component
MLSSRTSSRFLILPAVIVAVLFAAAPARAQYFGRNTVQWEREKFEMLKTRHFDIYYYAEGRLAAEQTGRMAERWYTRLSRILGHELKERQPVILYASHPQFQQTNTLGGAPGEGTGGVTEAFKRRIVLPVGGSLAETDHVLGHELVHAFQYSMTGQGRISDTNYPSALRMPLWFIEGMAEYLSVGPSDPLTAMWIRDAARKEKGLPTIHQLESPRYFPYRYGQALWAYLAGRYGDRIFGQMLRALGPRTNDVDTVLKMVLHTDSAALTKDWHAAIKDACLPVITGKKDPGDYGVALVTEKRQGGRLNVGPVLSPDGERLAFLSERELFSVELYVEDTRTGSVNKRLSRTVVDPHLESIQFIESSGAWDPAGQRFALGAVAKGRPVLVILDASGSKRQEIPFPTLGEIYTPDFSPDGRFVAFSALAEGFTDLFVYDLQASSLRRLTHDAFADLQPAWSPDGKSIAFVTDRFSTKLDDLDMGNYHLASVDVASGEITALPAFDQGKHINPQWSSDGKSLYFLSDRTGITNVYRVDVASQKLYQLTDLLSGVSGITALSPALTSATRANRLAYSAYDEGRYEIYALEGDRLAGWEAPREDDNTHYAGLIPGAKLAGAVVNAKADPTSGLGDPKTFGHTAYKPKLQLDYIGQPYLTGGTSRYGAFFGGGIAMSFSDMLGNHSLTTMFQADNISGFTDIGGIVGYVNRTHRFNWGLQVEQIPYIVGDFTNGVTTVSGQQAYVEQTLTQRIMDRGVMAQGYYPIDSSLRAEVSTGYRSIGFDTRVQTFGYSLDTGQQILNDTQTVSDPTIHLWQSDAAIVRDTSVFGATSPIMGQRFRFDVTPTFGTLNYTGVLADFRQYFMPVRPVTIAARVLHFARYGSGGEDSRLAPLFIGYPEFIRGYDYSSFSASECGVQTNGSCPVFDQLIGSRMLVGNFEVRAPLLGLFGRKDLYGPIPVEIGAFFDTGVAWDSTTRPAIFGGTRELVKSTGGVARVNVLGFAVLEIDWVKPLDRPQKDHLWQFNLLAGF